MSTPFHIQAHVPQPGLAAHGAACRCAGHGRRLFTGLLAVAAVGAATPTAALAQATIPECKRSKLTKLVSAKTVEGQAGQQYKQMLTQAQSQKALGPTEHPQVKRLRAIANRIIPFTHDCNPAARDWQWEVNLIGSQELNAFCMPGGKIAFYYGILAKLQLNDDEVAMIMGHEVAHALLEHARERMGKNAATNLGATALSAVLGLGSLGDAALRQGAGLLSLKYSRDDESEADALGLILAAKAGYNPAAGVTLWQKMMAASKGAPPSWLSTHPSGDARIQSIQARLPALEPVYQAAPKPPVRFGPPAPSAPAKAGAAR
jgi:predicted Zn-dependent protease